MSQRITAIYENGVLRPLAPLDLPEHSTLELDVEEVRMPGTPQASRESIKRRMIDAGLSLSPTAATGAPPSESRLLSDERRAELARLFAAERPLADLISEDRDERG